MQRFIEHLSDPVLGFSRTGDLLLANPQASSLTGYTAGQLKQMSIEQLFIDPVSLQPIKINSLTTQVETWKPVEVVIQHKDGFQILTQISLSTFTDEDNNSYLLSTVKDSRPIHEQKESQSESQSQFEIIINNLNEAVFLAPLSRNGVHGNFVEVNQTACKRLGFSREELLNMNARTINPTANLDKIKAFGRSIQREGDTIFEAIHVTKDGTHIPVEVMAKVITISGKEYVLSVARDVRKHKQLQTNESRFGRLINHAWDEIYVFDSQSLKFIQVNQGALNNLSYSQKEMRQLHVYDIKPEINETEFRTLTKSLFDGSQSQIIFETMHQRKDGSCYPVEIRLQLSHSEVPPVFLANVQDITERKKNENRLQFLANYDSLTGLPNRSLFLDRLNMSMENSRRNDTLTALIFLDLDGFKAVNDTQGHITGDELLKKVAERLAHCSRKSDTIARLGGDEFCIIASNLKDVSGAETIAHKVIHSIRKPFFINHQEIRISTSLGITYYPFSDNDDAYVLVKQADTAMYEAKSKGKNRVVRYTAQLWHEEIKRIGLENDLKIALSRGEFSLVYQPRVSLHNAEVIGAETLLRWTHPEKGPMAPAEFIPVLESNGLIHEVGEWVLNQACMQLEQWLRKGKELRLSVNVSARQLEDEQFPDKLKYILDTNGVQAKYLEIEVTEGILISQSDIAANALQAIKQIGVTISLDDFGSGYSSLGYLKRFAIDTLKIDRAFVTDLEDNLDSYAIVKAIINLARSLHLHVTAEGIETQQQLEMLKALDCHEGQGFYFSKPVSAKEFIDILNDCKQLAS